MTERFTACALHSLIDDEDMANSCPGNTAEDHN